jgi:hypothetical protein
MHSAIATPSQVVGKRYADDRRRKAYIDGFVF